MTTTDTNVATTRRFAQTCGAAIPAWLDELFEGLDDLPAARQLIGATNPIEAATGSIRGDYGTEVTFNLVHGSDSGESAAREIGIWFPELG